MQYPTRTHKTNTSNSELILLDFLFDAPAPMHTLRNEGFSFHHNVPYTHGLNDIELKSILEKYILKGILFSQHKEIGDKYFLFYGLTSKGGDLWEKERQPVWNLYVEDSYEPIEDDTQWQVRLKSTSIETLNKFLGFCVKNGFQGTHLADPIYNIHTTRNIIYWKNPTKVHEYTYMARDCEELCTEEWQRYNEKRVWWRSIEELQKFIT